MADQSFEVELRVDLNAADLRGELSRSLGDVNNQVTGFDKKIGGVQKTLDGTGKSFQQLGSNARYALYDVSTTLATAGAAMLGLSVASTAVAVSWEQDFAQVVRTTGVFGSEIGKLRGELVDLSQRMPVSFKDLAQIATLAGQLGVAKEDVAEFTRVTAQFSTITDLSVEEAATAFGRLDALLPDVQGNYQALGSAIAKVGVESVATESQIVAISTQISSMGAFAGLTAAEVVGLSGALASVGAAPELSRGTVTRVFTQMSKAIGNGGAMLENFAKISGVSADEFAGSFGTNRFGPIFQKFVEGLANTERTGGNAVAALRDLGITSVRDVPLLLRLAGAGTLLGDSFENSRGAIESATEIQRQYAIIAETTAARLQILGQNFAALLDAIGSANLGPIGNILDFLTGFIGMLTDIASTDIGGKVLGLVSIVGALAGVLSLAAAGLALFGASTIGMQQGLRAIIALAPGASAAILGTGRASAIASGQMGAASVAAGILGKALKALSLIGALLLLPDIMSWGADVARSTRGVDESVTAMTGRIKAEFADLSKSALDDFGNLGAAINRAVAGQDSGILRDIKVLDETLTSMVKAGQADEARKQFESLRMSWVAGGGDLAAFNNYFTDTNTVLRDLENSAKDGANGITTMQDPLANVEADAEAAEEALKSLKDAIEGVGASAMNVESTQIALSGAFNAMTEAAGAENVTLDGTNAASLTYRNTLLEMETAARDAAVALAENGGSAAEATAKYNEGREALIQSIQARGLDRAAAEEWAAKIVGSASEAQAFVAQYAAEVAATPTAHDTQFTNNANGVPMKQGVFYRDDVIGRTPTSKDTQFTNNATGQPYAQTRMYRDLVDSLNKTVRTNVITTYQTVGAPAVANPSWIYRAGGGSVFGPGTSTSDSIPAWLSDGEYVVKAAAVNKYGMGFMNALNSMRVPKFASGGSPSGGSNTPMPSFGGVVELGPMTIAKLSKEIVIQNMFDDVSVSRSSQRGDSKRRAAGDL